MSRRSVRLAEWLIIVAIIGAHLVVVPGLRRPPLLYPEYAIKTAFALACAVAFVLLHQARGLWVRPRAVVVALAWLVALTYALGLAKPLAVTAETLLRASLPLCFIVALRSPAVRSTVLARAIVWTALTVAICIAVDVTGLASWCLPLQVPPAASLVHRNNAAFPLAIAAPILVARFSTTRRNVALSLIAFVVAIGLVGCRSRTAWLAAGVGSAAAWLALARRNHVVSSLPWTGATAIAVAVVIVGAFPPAAGTEPVWARLGRTLDLEDAAMRARYDIYADAFNLWKRAPLLGWGAGSFAWVQLAGPDGADRPPGPATIDPEWSYAAGSGELFWGARAGDMRLFRLDTTAATTAAERVPVAALLPARPTISHSGRWLAYHEIAWPTLSPEHRLSLVDRSAGRKILVAATGPQDFVGRIAFSHDEHWAAYELAHHRGNEWRDELRLVDLRDGTQRTLTGPGPAARGITWAGDDHTIYFRSGNCIKWIAVPGGTPAFVACLPASEQDQSDGVHAPLALSADGRQALFDADGPQCSHLFLVDMHSGAGRPLGDACGRAPTWVGSGIAYIDRDRVMWMSSEWTAPTELLRGEQIRSIAATADGHLLVLSEDRGGASAIARIDPPTGRVEQLARTRPPAPLPTADHAHDDLLGVAFEAGLIAALAMLALLLFVAASAVRVLASARDAHDVGMAGALIVFIVLGTTNAPLLLAPSAIVFWFVAAAIVRRGGAPCAKSSWSS